MSNPLRDGLIPLTRISPEDEEQLNMSLLWKLAHAMHHSPEMGKRRCAVKGGTALAIAYGTPRVSTDLDLNVSKEVDLIPIVRKALEKDRKIQIARLDTKQHGRGYIRLWYRHAELDTEKPIETKIDKQVCDGREGRPDGIHDNEIGYCDGVPVYRIEHLAPMKANTLAGERRTREQARDLYDIAWLLQHHSEYIPPYQKKNLLEFMERYDAAAEARWQRLFTDRIMKRAGYDATILSFMAALESEPLVRRLQGEEMEVKLEPTGEHIEIMINGELHDRFDTYRQAATYLKRMGLTEDTPEPEPAPETPPRWKSSFDWHPAVDFPPKKTQRSRSAERSDDDGRGE